MVTINPIAGINTSLSNVVSSQTEIVMDNNIRKLRTTVVSEVTMDDEAIFKRLGDLENRKKQLLAELQSIDADTKTLNDIVTATAE
ncbi:MAG: hypothetical protein PHF24_05120 [Syntrophomonas sp.]|nr:hypothetical protein [Syntrophomonas sp.]